MCDLQRICPDWSFRRPWKKSLIVTFCQPFYADTTDCVHLLQMCFFSLSIYNLKVKLAKDKCFIWEFYLKYLKEIKLNPIYGEHLQLHITNAPPLWWLMWHFVDQSLNKIGFYSMIYLSLQTVLWQLPLMWVFQFRWNRCAAVFVTVSVSL